jgi:hypothetical protein
VKWLERSLMLGPRLTLCLTPDDLTAVLKHLTCSECVPFPEHGATTYFMAKPGNDTVAAVCMSDTGLTAGAYALLVHEAVHVWQAHLDDIGDDSPSHESEAYGVQMVAFQLISEYMSRLGAE